VSLEGVDALALQVQFDVMGLPVTVTPSGDPVIETTGIWLSPRLIDTPAGAEFQRRDPRRLLALSKVDVPTLVRGTRIDAAERVGDEVKAWRVDAVAVSDADHVWAVLIPWQL
jgi:hypothetical protein